MRGIFVDLEGSDGSGKSTVVEGLKNKLKEANIDMYFTREPGGTPISEKVRDILLDRENEDMDPRCEALLYAASRAQHTYQLIRPMVEKGRNVFSERYILSSVAYQGYGRDLGVDEVYRINQFATGGFEPDLVLYLEADPIALLERKKKQKEADRLESSGNEFFGRIFEGFKQSFKYASNVKRIDAMQAADKVIEDCWQEILKLLKEKK